MMPTTKVLAPISQFNGTDRLLNHIRGALQTPLFHDIRFAIAYAKSGPLERLQSDFAAWKSKAAGRTARIVLGIDQKGTSVQALTLALSMFDQVYVTNTAGSSTFHPKMYLFHGVTVGRAIIGSHNLTVGGTETNLEAGVELDYALPAEVDDFDPFIAAWDGIVAAPITMPLTTAFLQQLNDMGLLLDETVAVSAGAAKKATVKSAGGAYPFPLAYPAPPSALPKSAPSLSTKSLVTNAAPAKSQTAVPAAATAAVMGVPMAMPAAPAPASGATFIPTSLVIQIVPHDNGEVFLSKTAVNQNPAFFGFPFAGTTTTKSGKSGYPQRVPDPIVDITVYDSAGAVSLVRSAYGLNTVFYEVKGEIRVTVSPDIRQTIQPFSILHMQPGTGAVDYTMDVYNPGSPHYAALLASCNQTMPSGGGVARKMGWL
jgi:HKD family nuclease